MAAGVAQSLFPNLVAIEDVADVCGQLFIPFLRRRRDTIRGIILGGGSPCQGNSALNSNRQGLSDIRSQQPCHLHRLRQELGALPECAGLEFVDFLENVSSMPAEVQTAYNEWMGSSPILVDAACCGWVQRRRLLWLTVNGVGVSPGCAPPDGWQWKSPDTGKEIPELQYQGPKPIPAKVHFEGKFKPLFDPNQVVQSRGKNAMHPFTREFFHPTDRTHKAEPEAVQRFFEDSRRFPPSAYTKLSLVWDQQTWRQPSPQERLQMMGFPAQALASVQGPTTVKRQRQNCIIGNGFHLPMIVALFCLLPSLLEAKLRSPPVDYAEMGLRQRLQGTVWELDRLDHFPGLWGASDVVNDMRQMLATAPVPDNVWMALQHSLDHIPLRRLQSFNAWSVGQGREAPEFGPTPLTRAHRVQMFASLSGQRYAGNSSKGMDHLLPPGLGKDAHMAQAKLLHSPFRMRDWPEPDVHFVLMAIATWQEFLPAYTAKLRHYISCVVKALKPLDLALSQHRGEAAKRVAANKSPAFMAFLTSLLRWPDRDQALHFLQGYPIVGDIEPCGVFRSVNAKDSLSVEDWLGEAANIAVQKIMRSKPPRFHEEIYELTTQEQGKGFCSHFLTKEDLDHTFGIGGWRPLERFLIVQPCGKQRIIDNARKTKHNAATTMHETIWTINVDFIAVCLKQLSYQMGFEDPDCWAAKNPWLHFRIGTDDLPDAYRGLAVQDQHLRFSIVAVWKPEAGWRFCIMYGLAYGLESAVVAFNRLPQLGIAAARRCVLSLSAAYFDDELSLECVRDSDVSQRGLNLIFAGLGAEPQTAKKFHPSTDRHYLGSSIHLGNVLVDGTLRVQPKFSTTAKILKKLDTILETSLFPRDEAGKLRGDLNWMSTMVSGHVGRLANPLFTKYNQKEDPTVSDEDRSVLTWLRMFVQHPVPRDVSVCGPLSPHLLIYSDASFESSRLTLGWIILDPTRNMTPVGGSCVVPPEVIDSWIPRKQQIFAGETLCGLVLPTIHPEILRGRDIIWFIDNEAATSALVRGASSQEDVHEIAQYAQLLFHLLGARIWFEWIDSDSNPSDGLSRDGILDAWTALQNWSVTTYSFPPGLSRGDLLNFLSSSKLFWTVGVPRNYGCYVSGLSVLVWPYIKQMCVYSNHLFCLPIVIS